jgi:hypothetical protein
MALTGEDSMLVSRLSNAIREGVAANPALHQPSSTLMSASPCPGHGIVPLQPTPILNASTTLDWMRLVISASWADSTRRSYNESISLFLKWCGWLSIPLADRLPTSDAVLCLFVSSLAGRVSGSTIRNHLSAIRALHIINMLDYVESSHLSHFVRGAANLAPASSVKPARMPVTLDHLSLLCSYLSSDPKDVACAAVACIAFWGQCRLGELLPISRKDALNGHLPHRSHLLEGESALGSRTLILPWTKTTKWGGASIVLPHVPHQTNPAAAIAVHIASSPSSDDVFMFSYQDNNTLLPLTKRVFLARCNEIWGAHGLPRLTGHCFRIGGTSEFLLRGVPPDVVKSLGRWSSDSFLRYWRSPTALADRHFAQNVFDYH